jgi:hypothetical protein
MATRAWTSLTHGLGQGVAWLVRGRGRPVGAMLLLLLAAQLGFAWYENARLGLPLVREEPAAFEAYHLLQSAFAFTASALLVLLLVQARARPCPMGDESCRPIELAAGAAALAAAAAATALFLFDPAAFHAAAQEDLPLEWASALLLVVGAALVGLHALRHRRDPVALALAGGFCLVLVVIGMEEISWGQRIFGFATPDALAEMNWQAEFNFHNVQTDLSETLYYVGAATFLLLLPLLRDLVPSSVASQSLLALAPRRSVALVSAPVAIFNYGHWNLLPIQLGIMLAFWCLLAWSWAAAGREARTERAVYAAAAAAVALGQGLFLVFGPAMTDLPDATEYKEFFIGLGFAWYAATVAAAKPSAR